MIEARNKPKTMAQSVVPQIDDGQSLLLEPRTMDDTARQPRERNVPLKICPGKPRDLMSVPPSAGDQLV